MSGSSDGRRCCRLLPDSLYLWDQLINSTLKKPGVCIFKFPLPNKQTNKRKSGKLWSTYKVRQYVFHYKRTLQAFCTLQKKMIVLLDINITCLCLYNISKLNDFKKHKIIYWATTMESESSFQWQSVFLLSITVGESYWTKKTFMEKEKELRKRSEICVRPINISLILIEKMYCLCCY